MRPGTPFDRIVLMANDVDRLGGVGRFINEMARGFHGRGYETELVGISPPPEGHQQVIERSDQIVVHTLMPEPPPPDWNIRSEADKKDRARMARHRKRFELRKIAVDKLRELIPHWGSRTLIICTQVYGMEHLLEAGYDANDFDHPRVIGQYHGAFHGSKLTGRDYSRVMNAYPEVDRTVFLTEDDALSFRLAGLNNTHWIPNPVTVSEPGPVERRNTIVALGRYDEVKSLHLLLAAWEQIAHDLLDWNVELWGEGELRHQLQEMIDVRSIPRVRLMGKTDQIEEVLASSKIHVISSQHEGLPIAIVEAGLLGVPTVAFDCSPGVRSLVESERTGLIVPQNHVPAMADAIASLANDPERLSRMSVECAQDMKRYSPDVILDQWEDLFLQMAR
ncbi:glycosyltransferase involved in cell wall biosynthesis [Brevibacterium celere]|uniref:Glycosyltransferase involved in cell wall biosynthesis n=2 Tax=Brevibacterium TaxID=1696 RepID=A0A366ILI2_9MICO|nr:glycosyltransferase involved in cell wall biosynthesis [Brevibacterium celere]